jgi:hypothetical protein
MYHVELQSKWGKNYNVKVEGTTIPEGVQKLSTKTDLKKEFFDDYGLSISNYLLLMPANATVYFCRPIISFDPFEIDTQDSNRVFIPETLIDFVKTYVYVLAKRYVFEVSSGIKRYKNILAEDQYFKDTRVKISNKLKTIDDFITDNISTEIKGIDILTTNTILDEIDREKKKVLDQYKAFSIQKQMIYEDGQRALYEQTLKTAKAEKEYKEQKQLLENQLSDISNKEAQNAHINSILVEVKNNIRELLGILASDPRFENEHIPTFDELYEQVENDKKNNTVTS